MLAVGVGLTASNMLGGVGLPGFDPATLFALGEGGAWYDPSDLSSMFQDSAGTTPAAVNSPVGKLNDKSGRGNHALQATAGFRPILRQSGATYYLEFDGADDRISASFALAQTWDRVSAIRQNTWVAGNAVYYSPTGDTGVLYQNGVSPALSLYNGGAAANNAGLALGVNGVTTERFAAAASRLAINNGAYATGDPGAASTTGVCIGAYPTGATPCNMRLYGTIMVGRPLTDAETSAARAYLSAKAGI